MLIDIVDGEDKPVGISRRRDVFSLAVNFRVVHVLIFNSMGEILLQQLSPSRERHPGYWGSSVAGYVFAAEDYFHAANRRVREELGIEKSSLEYAGKTTMDDNGCTKFIAVFLAKYSGPFHFDRSVIEALNFESIGRIHQLVRSGELSFTPTFLHVLRFCENEGYIRP